MPKAASQFFFFSLTSALLKLSFAFNFSTASLSLLSKHQILAALVHPCNAAATLIPCSQPQAAISNGSFSIQPERAYRETGIITSGITLKIFSSNAHVFGI